MATMNMFALLGDDSEAPLKPSQQQAAAKKPESTKGAGPVSKKNDDKENKGGKGKGAGKGGKGKGKGEDRPRTAGKGGGGDSEVEAGERKGKGGGRGGGRGGKGGKKGDHGGYDRRSGTGRGRDVSKDGAGVGNWGKPGEGTEPEAIEETQAEIAAEAEETIIREPTEEELARIKEREEEEKQMTIEEYLAAKALKKPSQEKKEARKVEAVDPKAVRVTYNEEDENYFVVKGTEKKQKNKAKKSKEIMAVEFAAPKREQVDERDGGKGKGGKGGKGKGKGEFGASPAATKPRVKQGPAPVMDEHSFPSL